MGIDRVGVPGLSTVAAAFGYSFAGYVFDLVSTYKPVFSMGMAVSAVGLILAWLLKPAMEGEKDLDIG